MKYSILLLSILFLSPQIHGQVKLGNKNDAKSFALVNGSSATAIYFDNEDYKVVRKSADLLASDILNVSGTKPQLISSIKNQYSNLIIIGTIGHSKLIDAFIKDKKIDVKPILNGWEQYSIQIVENPIKGVSRALVVAGSDHRGATYGALSISESIGVSPWNWWADVPVKKSNPLYIQDVNYNSKAPSIKYRGIFLNDEDWGLKPWAEKTFEKELGNVGPKTYAKIFELVLRLKGNMVAPAMHHGTASFYTIPENKMVADTFGIIMSSSHAEPLLYNNTSEWDKKIHGEWNYISNKKTILDVLDKRVAEASPFDNIYTIALRGIHDAGMVGVADSERVKVLENAVADERSLLTKHINKPIEQIPQIFVPYKEVLDIYERGMKVPEDITIVWPDDNFGYIKKLSSPTEQKRSGGSGVYYHISYLGEPHDYLWINSTPPALMFEELKKAYDTGADRYWLLNVGDIKPGELAIQQFMDMAWDIDKFNYTKINDHHVDHLASIFGEKYRSDLDAIMKSYYQLAFQRKPETMGWGWEWNSDYIKSKAQIFNTDFSFTNYNEAENRMAEYDRIADKAAHILKELPEEYKPAFYQLLYYPVKGASLMNKKLLTAQKNRWYAQQGRTATNNLVQEVQQYQDSIAAITKEYNGLLNGKWNGMMALPPGWTATYQDVPPTKTFTITEDSKMGIMVSNQDGNLGTSNVLALPAFNRFTNKTYYIEVYNKGKQPVKWELATKENWIKLSSTKGKTDTQERIYVSIDWEKAPKGEKISAEIKVSTKTESETVYVSVFNPISPAVADLKGLFVEDNAVVTINAAQFTRKNENNDIKIEVINGLGYEGESIVLGKPTAPRQDTRSLKGPKVEYDFYTFNSGTASVYVYALPTFALNETRDARYGVMVDDGMIFLHSTASKEYSSEWRQNVICNSAVSVSQVDIDKPGKHTLKLFVSDPGMVIQKVLIDMGGMKRSYLGPPVEKVD